jgi:hypothetical protein
MVFLCLTLILVTANLREIEWSGTNWIHLAEDQWKALMKMGMNLQVP